jgi:hypothetical protein
MAGMPTRLAVVVAVLAPLLGADFASAQDASFGQRLYRDKADCQSRRQRRRPRRSALAG